MLCSWRACGGLWQTNQLCQIARRAALQASNRPILCIAWFCSSNGLAKTNYFRGMALKKMPSRGCFIGRSPVHVLKQQSLSLLTTSMERVNIASAGQTAASEQENPGKSRTGHLPVCTAVAPVRMLPWLCSVLRTYAVSCITYHVNKREKKTQGSFPGTGAKKPQLASKRSTRRDFCGGPSARTTMGSFFLGAGGKIGTKRWHLRNGSCDRRAEKRRSGRRGEESKGGESFDGEEREGKNL